MLEQKYLNFFFDFNFDDFDFDKFQFPGQCGGPLMCACFFCELTVENHQCKKVIKKSLEKVWKKVWKKSLGKESGKRVWKKSLKCKIWSY